MRRIENGIGGIACSKFEAVIAFQLLPLNAFPIDERSVLAALIDEKKSLFLQHNEGVIARYTWIGNHQILIHFAAHAERSPVQDDISLLVALHQHQRREHSRAGGLRSSYGIQ